MEYRVEGNIKINFMYLYNVFHVIEVENISMTIRSIVSFRYPRYIFSILVFDIARKHG